MTEKDPISTGLDDVDAENARLFDKMGNGPEAWHFLLSKVTGNLSLRITRGSASRGEIETWIKRLEFTKKKMRDFIEERAEKRPARGRKK